MPPILKSMMLIGILAIIMSTADSWLNNASAIAHDIAKINSKITQKTTNKNSNNIYFSDKLIMCHMCIFSITY